MTEKFYVIGDPIAQSKSPEMHNAAFQDLGMDAEFLKERVKPENLEEWIQHFRDTIGAGMCVTIPHKVAVMSMVDEIDPYAKSVGAVNVIANRDGRLIGYNTDGRGFVVGLGDLTIQQMQILLLGAGGAAKGIYYALLEANCSAENITIANRSVESAREQFERVISLKTAEDTIGQYDLVINTTSVGMYPAIDETPISLENLKSDAYVSDIIYNPIETEFLRKAREKGATVQNGLPMFVGQGALAFTIWTGQKPNKELMRESVLKQLGE